MACKTLKYKVKTNLQPLHMTAAHFEMRLSFKRKHIGWISKDSLILLHTHDKTFKLDVFLQYLNKVFFSQKLFDSQPKKCFNQSQGN